MAKKAALGKGIASLINETPNQLLRDQLKDQLAGQTEQQRAESEATREKGPLMVDIHSVRVNPNQPRKIFKEKELQELSTSIRENGIIQPLIVSKAEQGFDLIAGERRLRAAKMAEIEKVPVIVTRGTEQDKIVMAIVENVQRSDLNCVEEALAYYQLLNDYHLTQEEVAKRLGKERSTVANFLRLLKLPREVVEQLQREQLSFGHGKVLAGEKDRDKVIQLAQRAVREGLSVRELEKLLKRKSRPPQEAPARETFLESQVVEQLKSTLEEKTGFHFVIHSGPKETGEIRIKFGGKDEFNNIYEYLLKSR